MFRNISVLLKEAELVLKLQRIWDLHIDHCWGVFQEAHIYNAW